MGHTINVVAVVDLAIHEGFDLEFEVEWWDGLDGVDPVPLSAAVCAVWVGETETEIDLESFLIVDGNKATLIVPSDVVDSWQAWDYGGTWEFGLVTTEDQRKPVAKGRAIYYRRGES